MAYASWSVVFGEQPSAAKWNILGTNDSSFNDGSGIANLRVGSVTSLKNDYKFLVYRSAALSQAGASWVSVPFDTKTYDTSTNIDVVTNKGRFTAPVTGYYAFSGQVSVQAPTVTNNYIAIYKGGTEFYRVSSFNAYTGTVTVTLAIPTIPIALNAGDYVEIFTNLQANPSTINVGTSPYNTFFGGCLISQT